MEEEGVIYIFGGKRNKKALGRMGMGMGSGRCRSGLDLLCISLPSRSCLCLRNTISQEHQHEDEEEKENRALIPTKPSKLKLKDLLADAAPPTLAFQLKPKMVVLRVSMHCNGCARKVGKHISKLEGVSSYEVDLETKMVVVRGDIVPFQVLESVSKVKYAELWEQ